VTPFLRSSLALASLLSAFFIHSTDPAAARAREAAAGQEVTAIVCVVRETDFIRTTHADTGASSQLLLADITSGVPTYGVTGVREAALVPHVGRRVEITGTIERARTTPVLTTADGLRAGAPSAEAGAAGVTPDGASAHEPADALASSVRTGVADDPGIGATDPATRAAALPRLNASAFRGVEGECPPPPASSTQASAPAAVNGPRPAAPLAQAREQAAPRTQQLTLRGCLARQTATGTALTPQRDSRDRLVLTNAVSSDVQPQDVRGAVPGSSPSSSGSGTVPQTAGTSGRTSSPAAPVTYLLVTAAADTRELTSYVGERVEVTGATDDAGVPPASPETAHPSAPTREIAVKSFRALGGACQ
jgi:hypothetical protein